jgi:hypothetical protein
MAAPSILATMNSSQQDTITEVSNGTYSAGGNCTTQRSQTSGDFRGALVLHAASERQVIIDLAPPDSHIPNGTTATPNGKSITPGYTQSDRRAMFDGAGKLTFASPRRLILVGFHFINGPLFMDTSQDITFVNCTWNFGIDPWWYMGWDTYNPGGPDVNVPDTGYNYYGGRAGGPRPTRLRNYNHNIKFLGCRIENGGSGWTCGRGDGTQGRMEYHGCATGWIGRYDNTGQSTPKPASPGVIGDPWDILHPEALGMTAGPANLLFKDSDFNVGWTQGANNIVSPTFNPSGTNSKGRWQCLSTQFPGSVGGVSTIPYTGPYQVAMENVWANVNNQAVPWVQFGTYRDDCPITGSLKDVRIWNTSGSSNDYRYENRQNVIRSTPFTYAINQWPSVINVSQTNVIGDEVGAPAGTSPATTWHSTRPYANYLDTLEEYGLYFPSGPSLPATPTAPTEVTASTSSPNGIQVAWTNGTGTIEKTYLEYKVTAASTWSVLDVTGLTARAVLGLAPSTAYSFRVRHWNAGGYGSYSATATATTAAVPTPAEVPVQSGTEPTIVGIGPLAWSINQATTVVTSRVDVQAGDLLLFWLTGHNGAMVPLTNPAGVNTKYAGSGAQSFGYHLAYRIATSADESADGTTPETYTFTHAGGISNSQMHGHVIVVRNANGTPFDDDDFTFVTPASTSHATPSLVSTVPYTLKLAFLGSDNAASRTSYTPPSDWSELYDLSVSSAFCGNAVFVKLGGESGTETGATYTASNSTEGIAIQIAIAPGNSYRAITHRGRYSLPEQGTQPTGATLVFMNSH